jgi:hypothetical protein
MTAEQLLKEISIYSLEPSEFLDKCMVTCLHDDTDGKTVGHLVLSFPEDIQCKIWTDSGKNTMNSGLRFRHRTGGGRCLRTHKALSLVMHIIENDLKVKKRHKNNKRTRTFLTKAKLSKFFTGFEFFETPWKKTLKLDGFGMFVSHDGDIHVWFENWGTGFNCWDNQLLFNAFVILGFAMQEDTKYGRRFL